MNSICRTCWQINDKKNHFLKCETYRENDLDISAMKKAFKRTIDFNQLLDDVPEDEFDIDEVKEEFKNLITEIAIRCATCIGTSICRQGQLCRGCTTWNPLLTYDRLEPVQVVGSHYRSTTAFQTTNC